MTIKRAGLFVATAGAVVGVYYGCASGPQQSSRSTSFRDVVEMQWCANVDRFHVKCLDGTAEFRSSQDIQSDNVCLAKPLMVVTASPGTFLGRIATGPNCFLPRAASALLSQPPTVITDAQSVVQPLPGAIPGCTIMAGVVLRTDVDFIYPSHPSYPAAPSMPSYPSYPCG